MDWEEAKQPGRVLLSRIRCIRFRLMISVQSHDWRQAEKDLKEFDIKIKEFEGLSVEQKRQEEIDEVEKNKKDVQKFRKDGGIQRAKRDFQELLKKEFTI